MESKKVDTQKIAERFISLMKHLGYENERQLGIALGYDRADNVYNATSGERMPGVPLLIDLSNKFEEVNVGWILTGNGEMVTKKSGSQEKPDLDLLTQIREHAQGILLNLEELKKAPPRGTRQGKGVGRSPSQKVNLSDKTKKNKKQEDSEI